MTMATTVADPVLVTGDPGLVNGDRQERPGPRVCLAFERFIAREWDDAIAELEASFVLAEDEIGETYSLVYAHGRS